MQARFSVSLSSRSKLTDKMTSASLIKILNQEKLVTFSLLGICFNRQLNGVIHSNQLNYNDIVDI